MNCAGSKQIVFGKGNQIVTAVPWFPIDTLSSRGLGWPNNQQRNIPRRQRICRFPPDDCRCFPPKTAPTSAGDAPRGGRFPEELEPSSRESCISGVTNIPFLFWLELPQRARCSGSTTYISVRRRCFKRKELLATQARASQDSARVGEMKGDFCLRKVICHDS
jgi:hypothetical protein